MGFFANIALSTIIALATFVGAYKYVPLSWFDSAPTTHNFGSTITTINGSDTLSGSRMTINNNFANLNTDKIEATQATLSSLSTVGTITSGTWQGGIIGATWGGTGSSTLAKFNVLLGSSTNPIGIVQGLGTSGQFLTSQGTGLPPQWTTSAIDLTLNYNWTGSNLFKSFTASSTITFSDGGAGLSFKFPLIRNASSTVLTEDGAGNLTENFQQDHVLFSSGNLATTTTNSATSTIFTYAIPANTISTTSQMLRITGTFYSQNSGGGNCFYQIAFGNGSAPTTTLGFADQTGTSPAFGSQIIATLYATSTTNEYGSAQGMGMNNGTGASTLISFFSYSAVDLTAKSFIAFQAKETDNASQACGLKGATLELVNQ